MGRERDLDTYRGEIDYLLEIIYERCWEFDKNSLLTYESLHNAYAKVLPSVLRRVALRINQVLFISAHILISLHDSSYS